MIAYDGPNMGQLAHHMRRTKNGILYSIIGIVVSVLLYSVAALVLQIKHGGLTGVLLASISATSVVGGSIGVLALIYCGLSYVIGPTTPPLVRAVPQVNTNGAARVALGLTELAAGIAGQRRVSDSEVWRAHLDGCFTGGRRPSGRKQLRTAAGFVTAAARMRWQDLSRQICRPFDWIVRNDKRIALLVTVVALSSTGFVYLAGGLSRIWDDIEKIGVITGVCSAAAYGWRKVRGIAPEPPKNENG